LLDVAGLQLHLAGRDLLALGATREHDPVAVAVLLEREALNGCVSLEECEGGIVHHPYATRSARDGPTDTEVKRTTAPESTA
jgi:hypothetical protein